MRYMLLIYGDESRSQEGDNDIQPWLDYTSAAQDAGVYQAGAGLLPTDTATTVRMRDGARLVTDGPFAETKEQLGGYYILDCADLDEALSWAERIPSAGRGSVEVRPVFEPPQA